MMTKRAIWLMAVSTASLPPFLEITAYQTSPLWYVWHTDANNFATRRHRQERREQKQRQPLYSTSNDSSGGGGLVRQSTSSDDDNDSIMKKQLLNAFTNLGTADQYDAVLTGLCAKILDDTSSSSDMTMVAIQDCTDLLEEMNTSKVAASSRSLMALIDVSFLLFPSFNTNKLQNMHGSCFSYFLRLRFRILTRRPQPRHKVRLAWHGSYDYASVTHSARNKMASGYNSMDSSNEIYVFYHCRTTIKEFCVPMAVERRPENDWTPMRMYQRMMNGFPK